MKKKTCNITRCPKKSIYSEKAIHEERHLNPCITMRRDTEDTKQKVNNWYKTKKPIEDETISEEPTKPHDLS